MTPMQLYEWARDNLQGIVFDYCCCADYLEIKDQLEPHFENSRTIPGTRQYHSFIPVSTETLQVRPFSRSFTFRLEKVTKQDSELEIESISGYVTCVYDAGWWLAYVLEVDSENFEVKLTFLHPQGSARSYKYPTIPDILSIPISDILSKVNPRTAKGRTYTLQRREKLFSFGETHSIVRLTELTDDNLGFICSFFIFYDM